MARLTMKERERTYRVLMSALAQEAPNLTPAERSRRAKEIWDDCFGDVQPEPPRPSTSELNALMADHSDEQEKD